MTLKKDTSSGMTTKVMKGSFWVLMGQVLPLAATFVASPFVIRSLGSEAYGILILVGLISSYFAFGDFGMAMASTRFGAEAYAESTPEQEGKVVRTAALIGITSSLFIAIPLFVFSQWIVGDLLKVPLYLQQKASIALKITSVAFVMSFVGNIFNTPQLSRMRMDLNVLINAGFKVLMTLSTPLVLHFGGDLVDATIVAFLATLLIMGSHIFVSGRLQPAIYGTSIDRKMLKPLLNFGSSYVLYGIGLLVTNNLEKFILTRYVSVQSLAYYSIAFTFAGMTTMFSVAMVQTLMPAFSQLLTAEKREQLRSLFTRCVRVGMIGLIPSVMGLLIIAKPFFTIWVGPDFGRESVFPFYILLVGVFFSLLVYIPNTVLISAGKSNLFAKVYMIEVLPYAAIVYFLIQWAGILGAAMAWSLREIVNALTFIYFTRRHMGLSINFGLQLRTLGAGFLVFMPPALIAFLYNNSSFWVFITLPFSLAGYMWLIWTRFLETEEKSWAAGLVNRIIKVKGTGN
ncbi:MAG: flippase [Sphingobacteriales bacterium]|nr:flippase [Sphingobacteriales bacterium]